MSRWTLRILAPLALLAPLAGSAEAGVGDMSGGALSSFGRLSPVQTVQYGGECWYDNGWNGAGYYQCGDEWNNGFGFVGPVAPAIRRHRRHGVVVAHPQAQNPFYTGAPSRLPGTGTPAFGVNPRSRQFGATGVHASPGFHAGAATLSPGVAGGGFYGGGNFHQFHAAGVPHIGASASPSFTGGGGLHGLGGATGVHISAPASSSFAGGRGFHTGGGLGSPHIGAPASPGFAGGGIHSVGGAGAFQGGGAGLGQGGIGHR
jgi:hypothetical protein